MASNVLTFGVFLFLPMGVCGSLRVNKLYVNLQNLGESFNSLKQNPNPMLPDRCFGFVNRNFDSVDSNRYAEDSN